MSQHVSIRIPGRYHLQLALDVPVANRAGVLKFVRKKHLLKVGLISNDVLVLHCCNKKMHVISWVFWGQ